MRSPPPVGRATPPMPPLASRITLEAMNRRLRGPAAGAAALAALLLGSYWLRSSLGIEWSAESVRGVVADFGIWGPVAFVALVTFRALLLVPSQILLIAAGLLFGAVAGTIYGALGVTFSGVLWFSLVRFMGREMIASRVPPRLRGSLELAGGAMGATFVGVATAYPFGPISAWHGGAGLTSMSFPSFALAIAMGSTGRAAVYTFFGSTLVGADPGQIALATVLLLAVTAAPLLHPRGRWWVRRLFDPNASLEHKKGP